MKKIKVTIKGETYDLTENDIQIAVENEDGSVVNPLIDNEEKTDWSDVVRIRKQDRERATRY